MSKMQDIQDWMRKYLFWVLSGFVLIFAFLAFYFYATKFSEDFAANVKVIDENKQKMDGVIKNEVYGFHPNEKLITQVSQYTKANRDTLALTWTGLAKTYQEKIYKWPNFSADFTKWLAENPSPTEEIPPRFLADYNIAVRRELKRIMESNDIEWPVEGVVGNPNARREELGPNGAPLISDKVRLNNIDALINRYNWSLEVPSSTQVRLAQEDLWVIDALLKVVKQVNSDPNSKQPFPPHLRLTKVIEDLEIEGYTMPWPAKGEGMGRVKRPLPPPGALGAGGGEEGLKGGAAVQATEAAPVVTGGATPPGAKPARLSAVTGETASSFGGGDGEFRRGAAAAAAPPAGEAGAPAGVPGSLDDQLSDWRYVDATGKPLMKSELITEPHSKSTFLRMPFRLRVHILQSQLSRLFDEMQNSPFRFEVNQVRINHLIKDQLGPVDPTATGTTGSGPRGGGGTVGDKNAKGLDDIVVEVQGIAYIMQLYDPKKIYPPEQLAATTDGATETPPAAVTPTEPAPMAPAPAAPGEGTPMTPAAPMNPTAPGDGTTPAPTPPMNATPAPAAPMTETPMPAPTPPAP